MRQPAFNIPRVVVGLLAAFLIVHAIRSFFLDPATEQWLLENFAFVPGRYSSVPGADLGAVPGAGIWSFVSYAFLHADWGHLIVNSVALAAFASPLAFRFGAGRFLAFSAIAAVIGALCSLALRWGDFVPLVGASAMISAHMAGAARFLFLGQGRGVPSYYAPAASLRDIFTDRRTVVFLGSWLVINLAFGFLGSTLGGTIAWEAHIGGFIVGLFLFPAFDPPVWPQARGQRPDAA
ncbi:MAG: rhomboid family intramembrane serine protease [Bauldia sp.]|nr:rhomboid family intramembrane serine protease [Bauldia sp.]